MVQFHSKDGSRGAPLHDGSIPLARNIIILLMLEYADDL